MASGIRKIKMNHKRGKPKTSRAGCLMCKPNKMGRGMEKQLGHRGFGKIRNEIHSQLDLDSEGRMFARQLDTPFRSAPERTRTDRSRYPK